MNDTFSFHRFVAVLKKDFAEYIRRCGVVMIAFMTVMPLLFWTFSVVYGFDPDPRTRLFSMLWMIVYSTMAIPMRNYDNANKPREGVAYAMLPASALEKFLSMFILCSLLTPVACYLGNMLVDALLTLLPFGGFHDFVSFPNINFTTWLFVVLSLFLVSSFFMLGNMSLKKRKLGKAILAVFAVMFMTVCMSQNHLFLWVMDMFYSHEWLAYAVLALFDAAFYYLTYRRIKNQKY